MTHILPFWCGPWSEAPITQAILVQTRLKSPRTLKTRHSLQPKVCNEKTFEVLLVNQAFSEA